MLLLRHKEHKKISRGFLFLFFLRSKAKIKSLGYHFVDITTMMERLMEKPPMEWIDKLFNCMIEFYGERWTRSFSQVPDHLYKTLWQSALQGLSYEEIRGALLFHKRRAGQDYVRPPTHIQFFWDATHQPKPSTTFKRPSTEKCNPEVTRRAISEIREKLERRNSLKPPP